MGKDGNFRFVLWDALVANVAAKRPGGLAPRLVAAYFRRERPRLLPLLDKLAPYYEIPRPKIPTTPKARTTANLAALDLLVAIDGGEKVGLRKASRILGQFSGWGGLSIEKNKDRFPPDYIQEVIALAHEWYTPYSVTDAIARTLAPYLQGISDRTGRLKCLEPSAGVGRFIDAFNRAATNVSLQWHAVELNKAAARIIRQVHPNTDVFEGPFEEYLSRQPAHIGTWNLVISNPPYGSGAKTRIYADLDRSVEYNEKFDFAYFLRRGLDGLAYKGIGVYVLPRSFMTAKRHSALRQKILLRHHLMGAYRLPSQTESGRDTFPGQAVVSDIVFFRSRGGEIANVDEQDSYIVDGDYFTRWRKHVLGREIAAADDSYNRYRVVGEFTGLPPLQEREQCDACTIQKLLAGGERQPLVRTSSQVVGDGLDAVASSLGIRVESHLARVARGDLVDARAEWQELHDALRAFGARNNPWRLLDSNTQEASHQSLLRAFTRSGDLVEALRDPPRLPPPPTLKTRDVEGLAAWIFGARKSLTSQELHTEHKRQGGTTTQEALVKELLETGNWFKDGDDWSELVPRQIYLTGDLWPKYDKATADEQDAQAIAQSRRLIDAIKPAIWEDLQDLSPRLGWIPLDIVSAWLGDTMNSTFGAPPLERVNGLVVQADATALEPETNWCIGWINHNRRVFSPNDLGDEARFTRLELPEIIGGERKKSAELGADESVDVRRVMFDALWLDSFERWLNRTEAAQVAVTERYNRVFRGRVTIDHDSQPLNIVRWTTNPKLQLKAHQVRAVKARTATRGGILGFDVGVGKTFTTLAIIALGRQQGWIRRPIVVVPAGIIWQWRDEVAKVLPDYSVAVIGSAEKTVTRGPRTGQLNRVPDSAADRARKWTNFQAGVYDVVFVTDTVLGKTQVSAESVAEYARERSAIVRSVSLTQEAAERKKQWKRTEREKGILELGVLYWVKETLRQDSSVYDPGIDFGDLGIDFFAYDEVGNIRKSFSPAPREFGIPKYMGSSGSGSWRAWQADFRASIVRAATGGTGILGLTGTLGENSPLEIYNLFHFVDPTIFENAGALDPEQWMDRYLQIEAVASAAVTGEVAPALAVTGFKNLRELRTVLFRWGSFISAKEADLKLPISRECLAEVDLNEAQAELYETLRKQARRALERGRSGAAFAAISRMRFAAVHPEILVGYDWSNAGGGLARKTVTRAALPFWAAKGWSRSLRILETAVEKASPARRQVLQVRLHKLREREKPKDSAVKIEQVLPPPTSMAAPKFDACAERILRNPGCGHIVFSQFTATHYWLREVFVAAGIPRDRIAVINGKTGDIPAIAAAFNGSDTKAPEYDVVIANSKAYRGANLQRRTCAIHNIDLTWTPADLEQRRGRGDRQGNKQPTIQIWFYISRDSFDGYMFNLVSGKARWQDKLYRSDDDRSVNPAMQLDLSEGDLLRLTAGSQEEAEALEKRLAAARDEKERAQAGATALRQMRQAAGRFAKARAAVGARRERLISEAEERLRVLSTMRDDVWPWKELQGAARERDMLVPEEVDSIPLYTGLRLVASQRMHVGRIEDGAAGLRIYGDYVWKAVSHDIRGRPAALEDWDAREDDKETSRELARALERGEIDWGDLGWRWADPTWLHGFWGRFGPQIAEVLAETHVLPVLSEGGLELQAGAVAVDAADRVMPPTDAGWRVFVDQANSSLHTHGDLNTVAQFWWSRPFARRRAPIVGRETKDPQKPVTRSAVACPLDVSGLRSLRLSERLSPHWESLDRDPKDWRDEFSIELATEQGRPVVVEVRLQAPPTLSQLTEAVLTSLFEVHVALVGQLDESERALGGGYSAQRWASVQGDREAVTDHLYRLSDVLGTEAAEAIDFCARRSVARHSSDEVQAIIDLELAEVARHPEWPDGDGLQARARKAIKGALRARGVGDWQRLAEDAVDRAARPAKAKRVKSGDRATVTVSALPKPLRDAASDLGYRLETIGLEARAIDELRTVSAPGTRSLIAMVVLSTGERVTKAGQWSGTSPFATSPVDTGQLSIVRPGVAHLHLSQGRTGVRAGYVVLHPQTFEKLGPPAPLAELTTGAKLALAIILEICSSFRGQEFRDAGLGPYGPKNRWVVELERASLVTNSHNSVAPTGNGRAMLHRLNRRQLLIRFQENLTSGAGDRPPSEPAAREPAARDPARQMKKRRKKTAQTGKTTRSQSTSNTIVPRQGASGTVLVPMVPAYTYSLGGSDDVV